jgi:hypothetical protein
MLRPVNGDRFLVSFSQLCRGLGRHVECLLWDAVAVSFLALARCWATEVQTRFDRWRLGHRRWSARWRGWLRAFFHVTGERFEGPSTASPRRSAGR